MTPTGSGEPTRPVAAVGAVVVDGGRLLMVKRGGERGRGLWAVPGGHIEWGEPLRAAVRREVREETGLEVEVGDLVWSGELIGGGTPPSYHFVILDYRAEVVGGDLRAGDDADEAVFLPLADIRRLPMPPTMFELLEVLGG
jgi:ADP-ribose pyrophosphatase YjhB (NUDIX family)